MISYVNNQKGFSLVETLVAISILLIIIAGPMAISSSTAKSSSFASEQVQAFFLAQEGAELAQKAKSDLLLEGLFDYFGGTASNPWDEFADSGGAFSDCFKSTGCGLEWHSTTDGVLATPIDCDSSPDACRLHKNTDLSKRSQFTHVSGVDTETPFTRRIYFETGADGLSAGREVKVTAVVTWRTGSIVADQKVEVETFLYNIYATP